jgi:hypothetical protein
MGRQGLEQTARALVAEGKGILAADESTGTIKKRFESIKTESTADSRRDYRELLFRSNEAMKNHISGVILYDETIRQKAKDGTPLVKLIEAAGGIEVFPKLAVNKNAKDRILSAGDVIAAAPDIIIGSWCGKKFVPAKVSARPGFAAVPAVATGHLHEIKSALILQPGPAALTDGLDQLMRIVADWAASRVSSAAR